MLLLLLLYKILVIVIDCFYIVHVWFIVYEKWPFMSITTLLLLLLNNIGFWGISFSIRWSFKAPPNTFISKVKLTLYWLLGSERQTYIPCVNKLPRSGPMMWKEPMFRAQSLQCQDDVVHHDCRSVLFIILFLLFITCYCYSQK